jgi:hypothetical protein
LTRTFQIVTKVKGDNFRTIATVVLRQYSDDAEDGAAADGTYESGKVNIWRERAADVESQGTTIILTGMRPQAREALQSQDIWAAIEQDEGATGRARAAIEPPKYHIGRIDQSGALLKKSRGQLLSLPWQTSDSPTEAFKKLVDSVWEEVYAGTPNPRLDGLFDYYLRMVWQLSLAVPLPYVSGHLFDVDLSGWALAYLLSNEPKGTATPVDSESSGSIRVKLGLTDPIDDGGNFVVLFDDLKLSRPIKFHDLPTTNHALKMPLVFFGRCREEFRNAPAELSGGPLEFEAYLMWNPKIAPTEHQGALIRIHGSSGTLFDSTFMRYQVSEQTRLRQTSCEIFVTQGLESALNIDRESFNNAHPHSVFIRKWLHSALRQLANVQKRLASEVRVHTRGASTDVVVAEIQRIAGAVWRDRVDDPASQPPAVAFADNGGRSVDSDTYMYSRAVVFPDVSRRQTTAENARTAITEEKLKAMVQVLAAFGLLDGMPVREQEQLVRAFYEIMVGDDPRR